MTRHFHRVPAAAAAAALCLSPVALATAAHAAPPDSAVARVAVDEPDLGSARNAIPPADEPDLGKARNGIPPVDPGAARNDIGPAADTEPTPTPAADPVIDSELVTIGAVSTLAALGIVLASVAVLRRRYPRPV